MLLLDALVLGVLASVLGLVLGEVLSVALFSANPGYLSFAFPIGSERIVSWSSVALALAGGLLAAIAGVLVPLRGAILARRRGPLASRPLYGRPLWLLARCRYLSRGDDRDPARRDAGRDRRDREPHLALLLCLPALLDLAVDLSERVQRLFSGGASYLALIELRSPSNRARSLAIAATGAIAVFGSVSIQGRAGEPAARTGCLGAGDRLRRGCLDHPQRRIQLVCHDPLRRSRRRRHWLGSRACDRCSATAAAFSTGAIVEPGCSRRRVPTSTPSARARSSTETWRLRTRACASTAGWWCRVRSPTNATFTSGQSFTLPTSHPMTLRVAALSTNLGWPPGALVLNADDYAQAWGSDDLSAYQLDLAAGASAGAVKREAQRAIGPGSGLQVQTRAQREKLHFAQAAQGLSRLTQIRTLVLIAAVLAMAAAMGAMIWQRRARLADMKVDGFSRSVLWRALLWESVILLGAGCTLGALFGLYGQLVLSRALSQVNGFPLIEHTPLTAALGSLALITAVAVAIVAIPGYVAARVRASVGLQE